MFKSTIALFALLGLATASPAPAPRSDVSPVKRDASSGSATYFEVGLGACGWTNSDQDMIVAVNSAQFDNGGHCGKWLTIQNNANGNTVAAYAADECPTCPWGSLDLSPQAFGQLNGWNYDEGMFDITWWWND